MEITDRSKDVIKSGGEWISSIVLENIAVAHPDVAEAAVIAAGHPRWDGAAAADRRARSPGATIDPASVLAWLRRGRSPKWLDAGRGRDVPELPHTATGKVSKLTLRQRFRRYLVDLQVGRPQEGA